MDNQKWYVYVLQCIDKTLYCGITNNLDRRIKEHNSSKKGAKYTRGRTPVVLVRYFEVDNKSQALKLEIQIKKLSHKDKLTLPLERILMKSKMHLIAQETLEVLKFKAFLNSNKTLVDISSQIDTCVKNTKLYEDNVNIPESEDLSPTIEVINETTCQGAQRLLAEGKDNIVALNFASAITPGGGWLHGAIAQEEDLARCSALFSSIRTKTAFYNKNICLDNSYYTDDIIYSPNVPFFRGTDLKFLDNYYPLSIITSPAPNLFNIEDVDEDYLQEVLKNRIEKIIKVAIDNNHKNIILGAFGCGAFGNDPIMVSKLFLDAIIKYPKFEHVCFSVYDTRENQPVFNTFKSVINGEYNA